MSAKGSALWLQVHLVKPQQPQGLPPAGTLKQDSITVAHSTAETSQSNISMKRSLPEQQISDASQITQQLTQNSTNVGQSADIIINVETGVRLPEEELAGVKFESAPIHFRIKINPAGFVDDWKTDDILPEPFTSHPEYLNTLVRNMQFERRGETYYVEWLGFIDKKDQLWLAKLKSQTPAR